MKRLLIIMLLAFTTSQLFAVDLPEHLRAVSKEHIANTPPCETIIYNGKEYVKRYEYHNNFESYISTTYPKGEAERVDSLKRVMFAQEREVERSRGKENYTPAFVSVDNYPKAMRYIKKAFKKREIKALASGKNELVFRMNIIANAQKEVLHYALSYVSDSPETDLRVIKLQEQLHKVIKLRFPENMRRSAMTEEDLFNMRAALILGENSKKMGIKTPDPSKFVKTLPSPETMGYDYFTNGSMIRLENIYNAN